MARYVRWLATALVACWTTVHPLGAAQDEGQENKTGHDHAGHAHDHGHAHLTERDIKLPRDFVSAVARLRACGTTLHKQVEAQEYDKAHAALDEATIVLGKLMPLARASGVPKSRWLEINVAGKDLKRQLAQIDDQLHAKGRVDLRAASKPIDDSLRKLEAVAAEHGAARQAMKP